MEATALSLKTSSLVPKTILSILASISLLKFLLKVLFSLFLYKDLIKGSASNTFPDIKILFFLLIKKSLFFNLLLCVVIFIDSKLIISNFLFNFILFSLILFLPSTYINLFIKKYLSII